MKILIVEDDPMVRNINAGFIKKIDPSYKIFEATHVEAAKNLLETHAFDLVLLDVYLGDVNGPELLKWLRKRELDVDVVLITADNSAETVETVFRLGVVDYLIKPFNFERFKEAIAKVLHRRTQFKGGEAINQSKLDQWFLSKEIPELKQEKGVNLSTYALIKEALIKEGQAITAKEIADKTDLARVTVRRYLEHMVEQGLAVETQHYGKVGRPQKKYQWIDEGDV